MLAKPNVAVLASFDADHFAQSQNLWPKGLFPNVEVYAFMHNCLSNVFGKEIVATGDTALRVMAKANKDSKYPRKVAQWIHDHFPSTQIPAISTFLPEISAPKRLHTWQSAQQALEFLVRTIFELRENYGHPCRVLELVGGSRINGMYRGEDSVGDGVHVVNCLTREVAVKHLLLRLAPVAQIAKEMGVFLAIEMEPGPLFTVGDWESLLMLSRSLESAAEPLHSVVGLNLDIAHWAFLAGISPQMVMRNPCVKNRIVHAHISDHSRGHCSDAVPSMFHGGLDFLPWLSLLVDLMNRDEKSQNQCLPFNGFISCELESAYDLETVELAQRIVRRWIDYCC